MKKIFIMVIFMACGYSLYTQTVMFQPEATVGFYNNENAEGLSYSYGGKIILMSNLFQRYGILINHLVFNNDKSYLSIGIYLEQVLFSYFNMGIGTVGYIGLSDNKNPFGLYTHLGFEYPFANRFHVLVAYRSDMIFSQPFTTNNAFMLGIGIHF